MTARNRSLVVVTALACSVAGAGGVAAQSLRGTTSLSTLGVSLESWHVEDDALTMVALHAGRIVDHGLGVDFTLAAWPEGVFYGGVLLLSDLGPAWAVVRDDASIAFRAGLSGFAAMDGDDAVLLPGLHAGVAAILQTGLPVGVRLDAVFRAYRIGNSGSFLGSDFVPTFSLGFGVTRGRGA